MNLSKITSDESQAFISRNDFNELVGSEMRPDIVKITSVHRPTLRTLSEKPQQQQQPESA